MKKLLILIAVLVLLSSHVLAQGPGGMGRGMVRGFPVMEDENNNGIPDGLEDDDNDGIINRDDEDYERDYHNREFARDDDGDGIPNAQDPDFVPLRARIEQGNVSFPTDIPGLRRSIEVRQQNIQRQIEQYNAVRQRVYQNHMGAMGAAYGLTRSANFLRNGTAAGRMHHIGLGLNNSIQRTLAAEERIQSRGRFRRFFLGGDQEAASELEEEWNQNRERVQELMQIMNQEEDDEVKAAIEEQIQEIQQEQQRIRELILEEQGRRGLFGWFGRR